MPKVSSMARMKSMARTESRPYAISCASSWMASAGIAHTWASKILTWARTAASGSAFPAIAGCSANGLSTAFERVIEPVDDLLLVVQRPVDHVGERVGSIARNVDRLLG